MGCERRRRFFDGSVSHLVLWGAALDPAAVAGLYASYRNGTNATGERREQGGALMAPGTAAPVYCGGGAAQAAHPRPCAHAGAPLVTAAEGGPDPASAADSSGGGLSAGEIVGIVLASLGAAVAVLTVLALLATNVRNRRRG